jgi:hypothetical protein
MRHVVFSNYGQAVSMQLTTSQLYGYPLRGRGHAGHSRGPSKPGYGWTMRQYDVLEHPTAIPVQYAHPEVDPDTEGDINRINDTQAQQLRDWSATAVELTPDWYPGF